MDTPHIPCVICGQAIQHVDTRWLCPTHGEVCHLTVLGACRDRAKIQRHLAYLTKDLRARGAKLFLFMDRANKPDNQSSHIAAKLSFIPLCYIFNSDDYINHHHTMLTEATHIVIFGAITAPTENALKTYAPHTPQRYIP